MGWLQLFHFVHLWVTVRTLSCVGSSPETTKCRNGVTYSEAYIITSSFLLNQPATGNLTQTQNLTFGSQLFPFMNRIRLHVYQYHVYPSLHLCLAQETHAIAHRILLGVQLPPAIHATARNGQSLASNAANALAQLEIRGVFHLRKGNRE